MSTIKKRKYSLIGVDGNAYAIMGHVARCMGEARCKVDEFNKFYSDAQSGDYNHLLRVALDVLDKLNERAKR